MATLPERDYTYYTTLRGMCRTCRQIIPARIVFKGGEVWQENLCHQCGTSSALIAGDREWYMKRVSETRDDHSPLHGCQTHDVKGCPFDCGPCSWHATPCQLPVISITNACNLRCPICFTYNRSDRLYHMPVDEMKRTVDWIIESTGHVDLINITGGEPTLHPEIFEILSACHRPEIGRVTMNSNGIVLAKDYSFCEKLAELDVYVILSFNTFSSESGVRLHGIDLTETKLQALDNLECAGVKVTLLNVLVRGENEEVPGQLLDLMRSHLNILSLTVQTMTYTGQGGGTFPRTDHVPVDAAAGMVCGHLDGEIVTSDFISRPSSHPLCYSLCYLFLMDGKYLPFTRLVTAEEQHQMLKDSYLLRVNDDSGFFTDLINRAYAQGRDDLLPYFRKFIEQLFPRDRQLSDFERQRISESSVRTIYLHAHMDEDTFDCSRAAMCPDLVPCEPGRFIPACAYNLFYRQKDKRFYA